MSSYSPIERTLAKILDSSPGLKAGIKKSYQRFQFLLKGEKSFTYKVAENISLLSPFQWANIPEEKGSFYFGYYDKTPFSKDDNRLLLHKENSKEVIDLVVFDKVKKKMSYIANSRSFSSQQATMASWIPRSSTKFIFNCTENSNLVSKIIDIETNDEVVIPLPIHALHPNGKEALTLNYKRIYDVDQEYGYSCKVNNFNKNTPLKEDGIWKINLKKKSYSLIISLSQLIANKKLESMNNSKHIVNHILYSPSGSQFIFIHRWYGPKGKFSRLYVSNTEDYSIKLLLDDRMISHFCWKDNSTILIYARTAGHGDRYYLLDVNTGKHKVFGEGILEKHGDGHPSYSPNKQFILTDTYPDKARQQHLLLYDPKKNKLHQLGRFFQPWSFYGPTRCDLHPRWSPDGKFISIDSAHEGKRMSYILNIEKLKI